MTQQLIVILSTLALLGSGALVLLLLLAGAWGLVRGNRRLARGAGVGIAGLIGGYVFLLLGAGLLSRDMTLPVGGEKYFCEIDCHVAYSITGVTREAPGAGVTGWVWIVTLRTRFDETTISPSRGREAPLWPSRRLARLLDSAGALHEPLSDGAEGGGAGAARSTPLTTALRPGESYTTELRFALPAGVGAMDLLVEDAEGVSTVLIGHERSPWHGKTLLALPSPPS